MRSEAETVEQYLSELPESRRDTISQVRDLIRNNLPEGYVEVMNWGMITYEVPLDVYPDTYNKKPLMYAALASQKNHMAVYLCGLYCNFPGVKEDFLAAYENAGKKLDMGASCVRFKRKEQLELDAVAKAIASVPADEFVAYAKSVKRKR